MGGGEATCPRLPASAGAGPEPRGAGYRLGIPDRHRVTSPGLTYCSFPVCSKATCPWPSPYLTTLLPGEKCPAGGAPQPGYRDTLQSQAVASLTLPGGQRVTLEFTALAGHWLAAGRLLMHFPC